MFLHARNASLSEASERLSRVLQSRAAASIHPSPPPASASSRLSPTPPAPAAPPDQAAPPLVALTAGQTLAWIQHLQRIGARYDQEPPSYIFALLSIMVEV